MKTTYSWRPAKRLPLPPPNRKLLKKLICRTAELAGLPAQDDWVADIRFVGDRTMAKMNADFVGHEGTTDVITFSYFDDMDSFFPGDVGVELLICMEVAMREGMARQDSSFAEEMALYIAHGFLHASGEDDLSPAPRRRMRQREAEVMAQLRQEFDLETIFGTTENPLTA
ncbi:MAG: rRNA maturation RNase YbeY [Lentisphaeria bacterium]|nr:rRNA maturation RNase YbeY [Lentisphaeria bacterium]